MELATSQKDLLDRNDHGVLATADKSGLPRQSVVYYVFDEGTLLISTLAERLKARDVIRTGWASLSVSDAERPHPSATFSGPAEIRTEDIGESTARIMGRITGQDPPEPLPDAELAGVGRVILAITIDRVSAASYL